MSNAAIILVNSDILLEMLGFKGGKLHRAEQTVDLWQINQFEFLIEHEDLPHVQEGSQLQRIVPVYESVPGWKRVQE